MKVVNKIMIGIAVLCLLLCGGILVFALNPDMTSSLAQKLYGNTVDMPPGTEETGEGQTSGNGNISVTLPNGMPGEMNGHVAPSMDQMQIPDLRTVFIGTGCRHQLEDRPHRIGVQGTLDHGAVRILHGFSQCIGRVAGKAGKPQNVPAFHVHDYHTALLQ